MSAADPEFEAVQPEKEHPFALLGRLKAGKS
jgi:hypothetical protein